MRKLIMGSLAALLIWIQPTSVAAQGPSPSAGSYEAIGKRGSDLSFTPRLQPGDINGAPISLNRFNGFSFGVFKCAERVSCCHELQ